MPDDYYHNFDGKKGIFYILRTEEKNIPQKYKKQILTLFGKDALTVAHLKYIKADDFDKYVDLYKYAGVSVFKIVAE